MNKSIKSLIFIIALIGSATSMSLRKNNAKLAQDNNSNNIIVNGGFEEPNFKGSWSIPTSVPGWIVSPNAELGKGTLYSANWENSGQIAELDTYQNSSLTQTFVLNKECDCEVAFNYVARTGDESSAMLVKFNDEELLYSNPGDKNLHKYRKTIKCVEGENNITFIGQGTSNGYGMTIDNVEVNIPKGVVLLNFKNDLIKNGGFEDPAQNGGWKIVNEVPNWIVKPDAEVGQGTLYNGNWKTGQIAELDTNQNSSLAQIFTLEKAYHCNVSFDYIARTGNESSSMRVTLNGEEIYNGSPNDLSFNSFSRIFICKKGDNEIKFQGTGTSNGYGMTIDNVKVLIDSSEVYVEKNNNEEARKKNVILNGGFEDPSFNGSWGFTQEVTGWESDPKSELGRGAIYNSNWNSGQIAELDTDRNSSLTQTFVLSDECRCDVLFDYIARTGDDSSSMVVLLNDDIIFYSTPNDKDLHRFNKKTKCLIGINELTFRGQGSSNGYGMTIDNVQVLVPERISLIELKEDIIVNGGFENPSTNGSWQIINNLPGWEINPNAEIGRGTLYNGNWKTGQIAELDTNQNSSLSQTFNLDNDFYCRVEFDYISRTANESSSMKVTLNNRVIYEGTPDDLALHQFNEIFICNKGSNKLTFIGTGTSNGYGMTLDNVKVSVNKNFVAKRRNLPNVDELVDVVINGGFEDPDLKGSWQLLPIVPGWVVSPNAELGKGTIYNNDWKTGQIAELDTHTNASLTQYFVFDRDCDCVVDVDFIARTGDDSSSMLITLNDDILYIGTPNDKNLNHLRKYKTCKRGINTLTINGTGASNGYGMTIDNVKLSIPKEVRVAKFDEDAIKNGGFENPSQNGGWKIINDVPNWIVNPNAELGQGTLYNGNWKTGQIAELDTNQNSSLTQIFNLDDDYWCKVEFDYIARTGNESSSMTVTLNNEEIYDGTSSDLSLHRFSKIFVCRKGDNEIKFQGNGTSNGYGMTIDNVRVLVEKFILKNPLPVKNQNNLLINGDFEIPSLGNSSKTLTELQGWKLNPNVEIGKGSIYNDNWKSGQVAELDSNQNTSISQSFNLNDASLCVIEFDYSSKSGDKNSSLLVNFNDIAIFDSFASDKDVHHFKKIVICQNGLNTIEFKGTGTSNTNGVTIDNVSVAPVNVDLLDNCLKK